MERERKLISSRRGFHKAGENEYEVMSPTLPGRDGGFSQAGEELASVQSLGSGGRGSSGGSSASSGLGEWGAGRAEAGLAWLLDSEPALARLVQLTACPDTARQLRQAGCLPLLTARLHPVPPAPRPPPRTRARLLAATSNLVAGRAGRAGRREARVLGLLWLARQYTDLLRDLQCAGPAGLPALVRGCRPVRVRPNSGVLTCGEQIYLGNNLEILSFGFICREAGPAVQIPSLVALTNDSNFSTVPDKWVVIY